MAGITRQITTEGSARGHQVARSGQRVSSNFFWHVAGFARIQPGNRSESWKSSYHEDRHRISHNRQRAHVDISRVISIKYCNSPQVTVR